MLRDIHLFKSVQYHKTFSTACKIVPSCTDRAIELQQRSRWFIFSHLGPRIVRVPTVPNRNALFVALPAQI
ncbi:hypothetical protein BDR03DRAFT_967987, partial [Suillus americanus]